MASVVLDACKLVFTGWLQVEEKAFLVDLSVLKAMGFGLL